MILAAAITTPQMKDNYVRLDNQNRPARCME